MALPTIIAYDVHFIILEWKKKEHKKLSTHVATSLNERISNDEEV